jgi:uncharacterized protein (TIGR03086 family)
MHPSSLVEVAAAPLVEVCRGITSDQFDAPTPCTEYDVRGLLHHLLFWGPSLLGAARNESVPPPAARERDVELVGEDWLPRVEAQTERLVAAWGDKAAWDGMTCVFGDMELPAGMVGGMVMTELVVHGWDLARATGQDAEWSEDVTRQTYALVSETAEMGRQMGAFGPAVPVTETAPTLDRLLGLTGRDPHWTP